METSSTLVKPPPRVANGTPPEEPIVIADLADYLTGGVSITASANDTSGESETAETEWQSKLTSRLRGSDAYDLLEVTVEAFVAAVAAPSPDDHGWPGGWRGSGAFTADIARIAAPELSLYQSGRYPPADKAEAAIEDQVLRLVRAQQLERTADLPPDPIGWRAPETMVRPTAANEATAVLRELAIEAWRMGFVRRALLNIRRLIGLFTVVTVQGNAKRLEDVAENLRRAVIRTAQWGDDTMAERQQSRLLVLALAPELSILGGEIARLDDDAAWKSIVEVLDTIGWAPRRKCGGGSRRDLSACHRRPWPASRRAVLRSSLGSGLMGRPSSIARRPAPTSRQASATPRAQDVGQFGGTPSRPSLHPCPVARRDRVEYSGARRGTSRSSPRAHLEPRTPGL